MIGLELFGQCHYYFNKKISGKVVKFSLKTKNIVEATQLAIFYNKKGLKNKMDIFTHIKAKESEDKTVSKFEKDFKHLLAKYNVKNVDIKTPTDTPKLKDAFSEFIDCKTFAGKLSVSSIKAYKTAYKHLLAFTDENERIGNFDKKFFLDVKLSLVRMPVNYDKFKIFQGLGAQKIIKHPEATNMPKLQNKTVNNIMVVYKTIFEFCVESDYIDTNPLADLKMLEETKNNYQKYTYEELVKLFTYLSYTNKQDIYEMCFLLLSTGMRIGELANMKYSDLSTYKDNIMAFIPVSKTDNGIRKIAFHKLLNNFECFNDYKFKKSGYLFFNDKEIADYFSKYIMKNIRKIIEDKTKVIHSFRSNFIGELYKNNVEEVFIKAFVGHSNEKNITFSDYNKQDISDEKLVDITQSISYYGQLIDDVKKAISIEQKRAFDAYRAGLARNPAIKAANKQLRGMII